MIRTNNIPRYLICWHDLTEKERAEFDYLDTEERREGASFVRYKGWTYALADFPRVEEGGELARAGWHGYSSDTAFSATLVKVVNDGESVICGQYFSD